MAAIADALTRVPVKASRGYWTGVVARLARDPTAMVALTIILVIVAAAILAPPWNRFAAEFLSLLPSAGIAGLSIFHFARQFKYSEGMTPHHYLVSRRVERAKELLAGSNLSLSEVAFAAGFADQSHLTRRFGQIVGITPGQFRRSLE